MAPDAAGPPPAPRRAGRRYFFRAPSIAQSVVILVGLSFLLGLAFASVKDPGRYLVVVAALFLVPALGAAGLTTPVAAALQGRFTARRSALLALTGLVLVAPMVGVGVLWNALLPGRSVPLLLLFLLLQGPILWFRHLSLFGVSNPYHLRTLPVSLLQPFLGLVGFALVEPFGAVDVVAGLVFLLLGFLTALMLLRAADRPLRREFQTSGVSLIRPMLDHINERDPAATETLESFFAKFAIAANLSVQLLEFRVGGKARATVALPTVHPGPFASLGASDLPRKVADRLGASSGLVLVPHTPCNHELDIPTAAGVGRVLDATAQLAQRLTLAPARASPMVSGRPGSLARAQLFGDTVLVTVSQAPEPTDDIAFAVGDAIRRRHADRGDGPVALIDAHNSYVEDRGDIAYGSPTAARLAADCDAAIVEARRTAVDGAPLVGVASRSDYSIGDDGIGPSGIRVLAVRAAGRTAAYVVIDGNNLLKGYRAPILEALRDVVDEAEVFTTDNHIVHEVDGSVNPVGERLGADRLAADCRALAATAVAQLAPAEIRTGSAEIPDVPVLGPSWTERLLTSLGDTVSVFVHQAAATFLLLLVSSLVVLVALR